MSNVAAVNTTEIPVIDVAGSSTDPNIARALLDAAATFGFVYVKSQGEDIPLEEIEKAFELVGLFGTSRCQF